MLDKFLTDTKVYGFELHIINCHIISTNVFKMHLLSIVEENFVKKSKCLTSVRDTNFIFSNK